MEATSTGKQGIDIQDRHGRSDTGAIEGRTVIGRLAVVALHVEVFTHAVGNGLVAAATPRMCAAAAAATKRRGASGSLYSAD